MIRTVVAPERPGDLIGIDLAECAARDALDLRSDRKTVVVVLSGTIEVIIGGTSRGRAGGRASLSDAPGDAVYLPRGPRRRSRSTTTTRS